jgi:dihydrofolate synthase/folylpolyglutamate synthase
MDYTERIQVNGTPIEQEDFLDIVNEIYPIIREVHGLTTFEITTGIAFQHFMKKKIDFGVIEVGLGGRLDATNIIVPEISVIASISLDHTAILGDTIEAIAVEKAGIIKKGVPVVVSPQKRSVMQVFEEKSKREHAQIFKNTDLVGYHSRSSTLVSQDFTISYPASIVNKNDAVDMQRMQIRIPLLGKHQMENAGTAFCALKILQSNGFRISDKNIQDGLREVNWPGRFEVLQQHPYVIIDAAHNHESSLRLVDTIQELFPSQKITLIFGASEDKDIEGMLRNFAQISRMIIFTKSTHPRAAEPEKMQQLLRSPLCDTIIIEDVQDALNFALQEAYDEDIIVASGSIFIAAAVRETWFNRFKEKTI